MNISIHLHFHLYIVCIQFHIFYIILLYQSFHMSNNQHQVDWLNQILNMFLIQINNIHHYIINISLQKILLYNIKLNIPSLFNGSKSLDIVENVESLPNVGSPAL